MEHKTQVDWSPLPCGVQTIEDAARRVRLSPRHLQRIVKATVLATAPTVALGQARGSYRCWPMLGLPYIYQLLSASMFLRAQWEIALHDALEAPAWRETLAQLRDTARQRHEESGSGRIAALLRQPQFRPLMERLWGETQTILEAHGLEGEIDIDHVIVDRIEDDDFAVILLGDTQDGWRIPTEILRRGGIAYEKAHGLLMATRTAHGVIYDAWPALDDSAVWQPDPRVLSQIVDVSRSA